MSDNFDAFAMSPVPSPGPDAVPPEPFRGIYGMPMFVTIPTRDLDASRDFWFRGLGFFELFSIPGTLIHLRRWAFQDVLLVPAATTATEAPGASMSVSFACVLSQLDEIANACRALGVASVTGPSDTPWNTRDVTVVTPEGTHVILTAGKPFDPTSEEARNLQSVGIHAPDTEA
jgi:hypothetical protein